MEPGNELVLPTHGKRKWVMLSLVVLLHRYVLVCKPKFWLQPTVPSTIVTSSHVGMHMGLGGNPYGPAGTGKTESVKALGGLFGRQVLVFNCDEVRAGIVVL